MRISVIIPCYNAGPYIREALESVAAQTLPAHEIIVVDDGSTDDSLAKIAESGIPVQLLKTQRLCASGARLAGVQAATGEWLAYLDADDVWYVDHLHRACTALDGTEDVAYMAHLDCRDHTTGEVFAPSTGPLLPGFSRCLRHTQFLEWFADRWYFSPSGVVQRRDIVMQTGGPDPTLLAREDVELFLRVIHNRTWTYNPTPTWCYRLATPGSMSGNRLRCEQHLLNALVKNEGRYRGATMARAIHASARRVLAAAFTSGTRAEKAEAWKTAWPRVGLAFRVFYAGMRLFPGPFRAAIDAKRRMQGF